MELKLAWKRVIIVLCCCVWIISFLHYSFILGVGLRPEDIVSPGLYTVLASTTVAAYIFLVFFPQKYMIPTVACCLWGLLYIIDGGAVADLFLYLLGLALAFKQGIFRKHGMAKILAAGIMLFVAITSQFRYGEGHLLHSTTEIGEVLILLGAAMCVLREDIQRMMGLRREINILLPALEFTSQDLLILKKILDAEKYTTIAIEADIPLPTFKRHVRDLFSKLDVSDRISFTTRYAGHTFSLKDDDTAA